MLHVQDVREVYVHNICCKDTATTESYTYGHALSLHGALPIYAVERRGDDGDERMAFVGEREPARQAVEEARAEAAFKLGDLMADRALADMEFEPRAGEVEVARRRLEGAEGVARALGAVHGQVLNHTHGFVTK